MKNQVKFWIVIPAAGRGARFSPELAKQYWQAADQTLLEHSLDLFKDTQWVEQVVVGLDARDQTFAQLSVSQHPKVDTFEGSTERYLTVLNGLRHLEGQAKRMDWVLVHDAVRACLHPSDLMDLVLSLQHEPIGGILATQVPDTLKQMNAEQEIVRTVDRSLLWQAQTPQMFRFGALLDALELCKEKSWLVTDEASAMEMCNHKPKIVAAKYPNPKLTFPSDLAYVAYLIKNKQVELC